MSKEESTVEDLYNLHKCGEFDSNIKKMKQRESAIRYLEDIFEDGEYLSHGIWVNAYKKELDNMDEFSQWIKEEKYKLSEHTGLWGKYLFAEEKTVKFSELYQMFLETKKHEER